jgi:uncharacterized protein (TIGR03067 family)
MKSAILFCAFLYLVSALGCTPTMKEAPNTTSSPLVGEWEATALTIRGEFINVKAGDSIRFVFESDGTYRYLSGGRPTREAGSYTVESKATPATLDLSTTRDGKLDSSFQGIYRITGDTLTLAMAPKDEEDRPTKFESPKDRSIILWEFKRVNPKE